MKQTILELVENEKERKFLDYHKENPHIYELFKRYALVAIESGRTRFGANSIIERIRWYSSVESEDDFGFKINNNHAPYYARLFVGQYPQHSKFFSLRNLG